MELRELGESPKSEESAVPVDISVKHDRQDEDLVKESREEGNTSVPGCQNDLPLEVLTPHMITAADSKPLDSLQEIIEVEAPGAQEDNKRDINELMQEVAVYYPTTSMHECYSESRGCCDLLLILDVSIS